MSKIKKEKSLIFVLISVMALFFIMTGPLAAVEVKSGDVITSTNADQYQDYLPHYMLRWITDGWGMENPVDIHVGEPKGWIFSPAFISESKKNVGKAELTVDGMLKGYSGIGVPFLNPEEPNKALKIMYNQFYRVECDDWKCYNYRNMSKRMGGRIISQGNQYQVLKYSGRYSIKPKPELENQHHLFWASLFASIEPPDTGLTTLTWRYKDPLKYDDMWTYVPTLRRSIRLVSSERANPIRGLPTTWDDLFGFDGKISQFNYRLLKEQEILVLLDQKITVNDLPDKTWKHPIMYGKDELYEPTDSYVIEIKSKDPKYPEDKKIVWVQKNSYWIPYAEAYDKRGEFWKGYFGSYKTRTDSNGVKQTRIEINGITDFKIHYWYMSFVGEMDMNTGLTPEIFEPGALGTF